jgi:hypothetical protein
MAYIGAVAPGYDPTRASVPQLDAERFSGNASTTAFTLVRQVVSPTDIDVYVENVKQEPTSAYTVSGYTLNFTEAPNAGTNNIYVIYRASAVSNYAFVPDGSITYAKLANNIRQFTVDTFTANGTGSTVSLTEAPASANSLIVSVDGVIQTAPTNYTLSGSTITFTGVPDNGANVVVKHIGFRTTSTVTALQAGSVTATELADGSVTNVKIDSVANTKITGNIVSSQITSVANTQITGNIISSQIAPSVILTTPIISGNLNLDSAGTTGVRVPSANTISFHTAGTEDMRIDSTGIVAIGTTDTTNTVRLKVQGGTTATRATSAQLTIQRNTVSTEYEGICLNAGPANAAYIGRVPNSDDIIFGFDAGSALTERMRLTAAGLFQMNSGYGSVTTAYGCRAWVNFNGTGTPAIRASGNVSSLTDNGTGDYTINFATGLVDNNYAAVFSGMRDSDNNGSLNTTALKSTTYGNTVSTGSIRVLAENDSGTRVDPLMFTAAFFR